MFISYFSMKICHRRVLSGTPKTSTLFGYEQTDLSDSMTLVYFGNLKWYFLENRCPHTSNILSHVLTLKISPGHQNLTYSWYCPSKVSMQVWPKSIYQFRIKFNNPLSTVTLKIKSRSPKSYQLWSMYQWYILASLIKICQPIQDLMHMVGGYKYW